jgi:hypothetical protein
LPLKNASRLLEQIRALHAAIRDEVLEACRLSSMELLSAPVGNEAGDTIFAIDRISENSLLGYFGELARERPCLLIAEGLGETGLVILPRGARLQDVDTCIIVDPIDGTRGLMYQKRPAWILTGAAPYRGQIPSLADIELAVQTEIPLLKQHLCDSLWARRTDLGRKTELEIGGERLDLLSGERRPLSARPSRATGIEQGFGSISRFFPGPRGLLATIDDELIERVVGPMPPGLALSFEDQYISSGGQLYELMMGHDRWTADLRPLVWAERGVRGLCAHPYDMCTELIARAAGVIVVDLEGRPLDVPLDVETGVAWAAFANREIYAKVMPPLQDILREKGLL